MVKKDGRRLHLVLQSSVTGRRRSGWAETFFIGVSLSPPHACIPTSEHEHACAISTTAMAMASGATLSLLSLLNDNDDQPLPEDVRALSELRLKQCDILVVPPRLCKLSDLTLLDLANNPLSSLPDSFASLVNLRVVFFLKNNFEVVPTVLGKLPNLYMLSFKSNRLTSFPDDALAPTIGWLILTDNKLTSLPSNIGDVPLRKATFANNCLASLPESLKRCETLELLRIAANDLKSLPPWLFTLPRLAWLGVAGNPCSYTNELADDAMTKLPRVAWSSLKFDEGGELGSGASGKVLAATAADGTRIAVKQYHAQATSDGRPEDEVKAAVAGSGHDNVMRTSFALDGASDADDGAFALGMPMLDMARYSVLGNTPSFQSVSRDTYPEGKKFQTARAYRWAVGIARALDHLHSKGICHGDVYGHNTLVDDVDGDLPALMSDFGAAWFFPPDSQLAPLIERMEMRAFGCMLEELAERCDEDDDRRKLLSSLASRCMSEDAASRPRTGEVRGELEKLLT